MEPDYYNSTEPYPIETELSKREAHVPGFSPIWYKDLAALEVPTLTWVVDKLIPDGSISIISAPPGQYKTWLAYDIAIKVECGEYLFGQLETKETKVLIVDDESLPGRLRERLMMLGISEGAQIAISSGKEFKLSDKTAKSLISYCIKHAIGLIIFDSLTRIHNSDENLAKDMSVVMGDLKRIAQAGIAVVLIHHNRKRGNFEAGGANEMRGSGDILAACDVHISIKRKTGTNVITVTQDKNRDAADLKPFELAVNSDDQRLWFEYLGKAPKRKNNDDIADEAILELMADGTSRFQAEIITALTGTAGSKAVSTRLPILVEQGLLSLVVGANNKHYYQLVTKQIDE